MGITHHCPTPGGTTHPKESPGAGKPGGEWRPQLLTLSVLYFCHHTTCPARTLTTGLVPHQICSLSVAAACCCEPRTPTCLSFGSDRIQGKGGQKFTAKLPLNHRLSFHWRPLGNRTAHKGHTHARFEFHFLFPLLADTGA